MMRSLFVSKVLAAFVASGIGALGCHAHDPGPPAPASATGSEKREAQKDERGMSEPARLMLLRMQVGYVDREAPYGEVAPPAALQDVARGGAIGRAQIDAARARWDVERARDEDPAEFFWLTRHLSDAYEQAGRGPDATAVEEGALDRLKDAGYRQILRSRLGRRAANASDLVQAHRWLLGDEDRPTDINIDSERRMARAALAFAEHDWAEALRQLGRNREDVPFTTRWMVNASVKRAHALEQAGELGLGSAELMYWMRGPRDQAMVMHVPAASFAQQIEQMVTLHHYAADSYSLAKVRLKAPAPPPSTGI